MHNHVYTRSLTGYNGIADDSRPMIDFLGQDILFVFIPYSTPYTYRLQHRDDSPSFVSLDIERRSSKMAAGLACRSPRFTHG
jgi:hypothetical protein